MNKYAYRNKLAVVTGVSFEIGKAYAKELAAQACHAILVARSKDKLDAMEREINVITACRLMHSLAICPKRMPRVNWPNKYPNWACRSIFSSTTQALAHVDVYMSEICFDYKSQR
ncbi:SDR family NAD(P)-dependent oxidoreductase [Paenibacillus sp. ALJ109b]|uniref:SDR family NAD(P)-dependent oxidoreductase n=1 Tax=Paenibacillus sp. ALJ109b TaxID=2709068 RepID=UPI0019674742|nr:SDR family NAD(P)-dependent oxidoreductase [Paenibacillus sp. ALJ109b]